MALLAMTMESIQLVEPLRRAAVERELLVDRAAGGDAFEGVPQSGVTSAHLVDREVALEIAAVRAKQLDAGLDIWAPRRGPRCRIRRRREATEIERGAAVEHAADLDRDVRAL